MPNAYDPPAAITTVGIPLTTTEDAKTATGTTVANGYAITAAWTIFTTVAASTGAVLPVAPGFEFTVTNLGANALKVYAPSGGAINGGSADAGVSVAVGASARFKVVSATRVVAASDLVV